jgi:hypothetical protein
VPISKPLKRIPLLLGDSQHHLHKLPIFGRKWLASTTRRSLPFLRNHLKSPEAGRRYLGLGRYAAYRAAETGDIPFIQVGRFKRVLVRKLEKKLGGEDAA